ncbi:MAG: hypothetical protein NVS3B14_22630 [Ktedonobacteraceae bacterium]
MYLEALMRLEKTGQQSQERPLIMRLQQEVEVRRFYVAQLPWWRHPLVGYLLTLPLVALGLLIPYLFLLMRVHDDIMGVPLFLVTVFVALLWGTGPSIFSILLGIMGLDYFFIPPTRTFKFEGWRDAIPLLLLLIAEVIVAVLTSQRESARRSVLVSQQELQYRASELEQANQQLEKADQLKDHFLSIASHELKTPITTMRGQVQLLQRQIRRQRDLPPELASLGPALEKIDQQTHRLQALVDDLLDLSILRAGKIELRRKRCDLGEICHEVVEEQQSLSDHPIELHISSPPIILKVDRERISQVVSNLLTNALKYSQEHCAVQVAVSQDNAATMIRVHNEGTAIPREQQERIFEPFYRTPDAQISSKKGWGLGLAISREIVERHEGRIRVESAEGKGTTFFVELPR